MQHLWEKCTAYSQENFSLQFASTLTDAELYSITQLSYSPLFKYLKKRIKIRRETKEYRE